jgi:hypothetical protein
MNKPSLKTRFLGNPIIGLSVYGMGGFVLYQWTQDSSIWPLGIGAVYAISVTMRAGEQADAYRNWKRAWDAMGDDPLPSGRVGRALNFLVGVAMIAALIFFLLGHSDQQAYQLALGWLMAVGGGGLAVLLVVRLLRLRRNRVPKAGKTSIVTVAIARPIYAVPDMLQSYRQLPEHCHVLMRGRPAGGAAIGAGH